MIDKLNGMSTRLKKKVGKVDERYSSCKVYLSEHILQPGDNVVFTEKSYNPVTFTPLKPDNKHKQWLQ